MKVYIALPTEADFNSMISYLKKNNLPYKHLTYTLFNSATAVNIFDLSVPYADVQTLLYDQEVIILSMATFKKVVNCIGGFK